MPHLTKDKLGKPGIVVRQAIVFNLLYATFSSCSICQCSIFNTDNPVMRIILTRNCVIGNNGVGCMRAKSLIYNILHIVMGERKISIG